MYCPNCKDVNYPCPSCTYLKQETKSLCSCKRDGYSVTCASEDKTRFDVICYLSKRLKELSKQETKMTRSEAIKNVMRKAPISYHDETDTHGLVLALEALGLIKFDEEKKEADICWTIAGRSVSLTHLREVIRRDGYCIVKGFSD